MADGRRVDAPGQAFAGVLTVAEVLAALARIPRRIGVRLDISRLSQKREGPAPGYTTGDRPQFSLPTKQFLRFGCLHLSWSPRFSRRSASPQCCRDLRCEVFIAQRIISISCAADFVHQAWFQLISKQLAVRRLSACRIRPPARRKEDAVLTTHPLRPARLPGSLTSGIPPGAPP